MSVPEIERRRAVVRWLLLAAALAVQVHALYLYVPDDDGVALFPHSDKVVHALLFGVPAAIALIGPVAPRRVVPLLALHVPVSEVVQGAWLPARSGDPWDVVADLAGMLLAFALARFLASRREAIDPVAALID